MSPRRMAALVPQCHSNDDNDAAIISSNIVMAFGKLKLHSPPPLRTLRDMLL